MMLWNKEKRQPLPLGRGEFDEWSERIFKGAAIPGLTLESAKWALANMLMHCPAVESFKPDSYFGHQLRKQAINQVAIAVMEEIQNNKLARLKAASPSEATPIITPESVKDVANELLADTQV